MRCAEFVSNAYGKLPPMIYVTRLIILGERKNSMPNAEVDVCLEVILCSRIQCDLLHRPFHEWGSKAF